MNILKHSLNPNGNNKSNKLVHRDYHSKNIFFKDDKITIIDYQDSLYGSPIYDLVSLLNDCYRDIDHKQKILQIRPKRNMLIRFGPLQQKYFHLTQKTSTMLRLYVCGPRRIRLSKLA